VTLFSFSPILHTFNADGYNRNLHKNHPLYNVNKRKYPMTLSTRSRGLGLVEENKVHLLDILYLNCLMKRKRVYILKILTSSYYWCLNRGVSSSCSRTICTSKSDYSTSNSRTASAVRTVAYPIAEIDVIAKAVSVQRSTPKGRILG